MGSLRRRRKSDAALRVWSTSVTEQACAALNLTVGLMSGSRYDVDRRAVDRLAIAATDDSRLSTLLVRLSVRSASAYVPRHDIFARLQGKPLPVRSPLGRWSEVELDVPLGGSAPKTLESLPKWLAGWKKEYRLIAIDLGPMDQVPCRIVGRYCDACYLVLGPHSCASHAWIMQHIALLSRCDVSLAGTLVVEAHAAVAS